MEPKTEFNVGDVIKMISPEQRYSKIVGINKGYYDTYPVNEKGIPLHKEPMIHTHSIKYIEQKYRLYLSKEETEMHKFSEGTILLNNDNASTGKSYRKITKVTPTGYFMEAISSTARGLEVSQPQPINSDYEFSKDYVENHYFEYLQQEPRDVMAKYGLLKAEKKALQQLEQELADKLKETTKARDEYQEHVRQFKEQLNEELEGDC